MRLIYISEKSLHINSAHTKFTFALLNEKYDTYYVIPLRIKQYIRYKLGFLNSLKKGRLNIQPYLRISRSFKNYETQKLTTIIHKYAIPTQDTYVMSTNMEFCHTLRNQLPSNFRIIYYILDRYSEYDNRTEAEKVKFDEREQNIIKECDFILCASQKLLDEARILNKSSFWFPNAVSENQIVKHRGNSTTKKIGMISDELSRINWPLICQIAHELEHYTIELIGKNDLPTGINYPSNIHIIGYVPFTNLGKYIEQWHAGLALYDKNRFNEYCCPLKYFEYSAFNIPTISTMIPEGKVWAGLYPNCIYLADDATQIAEYVKNITAQNQSTPITYTQLALENTWELRIEQLHKIFQSTSNTKLDQQKSAEVK